MSVNVKPSTDDNLQFIQIYVKRFTDYDIVELSNKLHDYLVNNIHRWPPVNRRLVESQKELKYIEVDDIWVSVDVDENKISILSAPWFLVEEFMNKHSQYRWRRTLD